MRKSYATVTALAAVTAVMLAGCTATEGGSEGSSAEDPITIRVSHVESTTSATHEALDRAAQAIEERTDGGLVLEIYPDGQLGTTTDILAQSSAGDMIIGYVDASSLAALGAPGMDILGGPFLFENTDQAQTFHESDLFAEFTDELADAGNIRVLALNYFIGTRNIMGNETYENPSDLEGVKLRTPPIETWTRTFEAVGAVPTTVEYTEVYSALQQGVVDAAENDINSFVDQKWYETSKNLTLTHHFQLFLGFAMGEDAFESLPVEYQEALIEELSAGGIDSTQVNADREAESLATLEAEGVTIVDADLDAYRNATESFYDGYDAGLLAEVRAAAGM